MNLQEAEKPLHDRLIEELIDIAPQSWRAIQLQITASQLADDWSLTTEITNPDGNDEPVFPTTEILCISNELADLYRQVGYPWRSVRIVLRDSGTGKVTLNVRYEY